MIRIKYFLILLYLISKTSTINGQTISLNKHWEFSSEIYNRFFPAHIPGSVHTDLFLNNLIPNPYIGENEKKLQWIDTLEWTYQTVFKTPNLNSDDNIELIFNGLDTYADIYLNDMFLFTANNMFIPWHIKLDKKLLKKKNKLKVVFKPTLKEEQKKYQHIKYKIDGGARIFTRKAAYQYGWDWAPKYVTSGIWQKVELNIWETARINDLYYYIKKIDSSFATVKIVADLESTKNFTGNIDFKCENQQFSRSFNNININKGINHYEFELKINNPKLWWTKNLGVPFLYSFIAQLSDDKNILDKKRIKIGIRTIELVRKPDQFGESFYFKLNGIPVYMKGANYVPQSSFPGNVTDDQYKKIISDAISANMNMLRVWGGGIYEKDIFYDLCDQEGILVWQDFMFANAMYLADSVFIKNIKTEAIYQVKRLSKHPCVAVWCGNNEIDEAWHNWGWPSQYSKQDSLEIWKNYLTIFQNMLPQIVDSINPTISYTSTSPIFGRGNPRSSYEGDNHYWYVWHDKYDFDWYNKVTGRFMSEFGFQSFPGIKTINYFDTSEIKNKNSEIIAAHQKNLQGDGLINYYMKKEYPVPTNLSDYIYVSQLLQAEGIRTGILAQRRAKPVCMGSLYWQLNDCWPAISWSSIDYLRNWKALHYFVKEDYENIILDPVIQNDTLKIFIVSDSLKKVNLQLKTTLMDFYGQKDEIHTLSFNIDSNKSRIVFIKAVSDILNQNSSKNHFLLLELISGEKTIDARMVYFTKPKGLKLNSFNVHFSFKPSNDGYELSLKSSVLIKNIYLFLPFDGTWSDNYFDLIPGKQKQVIFKTQLKIKNFEKFLKFNSLNHILNN